MDDDRKRVRLAELVQLEGAAVRRLDRASHERKLMTVRDEASSRFRASRAVTEMSLAFSFSGIAVSKPERRTIATGAKAPRDDPASMRHHSVSVLPFQLA